MLASILNDNVPRQERERERERERKKKSMDHKSNFNIYA